MLAGKAVRQIKRLVAAQRDRDFQKGLARPRRNDPADLAAFQIEAVLIEPALCTGGLHDVERDRQRVRRALGMDVQVRAVEHDLTLLQPRSLNECERGHRFTAIADDIGIIVFVIVAPIARPEIAERQEVEIVIVRQAQHKGIAAARANHIVIGSRPDIGADEELAVRRRQHHHLRTISIVQPIFAVTLGQFLDQDVAQKGLVIAKPPQPPGSVVQTVLVLRIEPKGSQSIGAFGQSCLPIIGNVDHAGHGHAPASWG